MSTLNAKRFQPSLAPETPADVAQAIRFLYNLAQNHSEAFRSVKGQLDETTREVTHVTTVVETISASPGNVVGPVSAADSDFCQFDGTTGKIIKDAGLSLTTDGTLVADSDSLVPSEKAVKTYVDGKTTPATAVSSSLPIYANNAAAIAGGLVAGDLYRSGADPDILYVVH